MPGGEEPAERGVRNRPLSSQERDEVVVWGPMGFEPSFIQWFLADAYQADLFEVEVDGVPCVQLLARLVYPWGTFVWPESAPMAGLPGWWP